MTRLLALLALLVLAAPAAAGPPGRWESRLQGPLIAA
jgi:hypothetical protein